MRRCWCCISYTLSHLRILCLSLELGLFWVNFLIIYFELDCFLAFIFFFPLSSYCSYLRNYPVKQLTRHRGKEIGNSHEKHLCEVEALIHLGISSLIQDNYIFSSYKPVFGYLLTCLLYQKDDLTNLISMFSLLSATSPSVFVLLLLTTPSPSLISSSLFSMTAILLISHPSWHLIHSSPGPLQSLDMKGIS